MVILRYKLQVPFTECWIENNMFKRKFVMFCDFLEEQTTCEDNVLLPSTSRTCARILNKYHDIYWFHPNMSPQTVKQKHNVNGNQAMKHMKCSLVSVRIHQKPFCMQAIVFLCSVDSMQSGSCLNHSVYINLKKRTISCRSNHINSL